MGFYPPRISFYDEVRRQEEGAVKDLYVPPSESSASKGVWAQAPAVSAMAIWSMSAALVPLRYNEATRQFASDLNAFGIAANLPFSKLGICGISKLNEQWHCLIAVRLICRPVSVPRPQATTITQLGIAKPKPK